MVAGQRRPQPFLQELLTRPRHRVDTGVQSRSDPAVAPGIAGIGRSGTRALCISVSRRSLSSALSVTMYLFTAGCFAITTHLRATGDIDSGIGRRIKDAWHWQMTRPVQ
jgi:hypothetical protein